MKTLTRTMLVGEISEIVAFCIVNRGKSFKDWDASKIFRYIAFHVLNGTITVERSESEIVCVGIAWPVSAREIKRRERDNIPQFDWTALPTTGDALFISNVFGKRQYCAKCWHDVMNKYPFIRHVFAYRERAGKPRLTEFSLHKMQRFVGVN